MDLLIQEADIALDARGRPTEISGVDELLQRALIRLIVKKGTFAYDSGLGSRLYTLRAGGQDVRGEAEAMVREALAEMSELTVEGVETEAAGSDRLSIRVRLAVNGSDREWEVTV